MAGDAVNRRDFLKRAGAITAAGTAVFSFEEQILQAHQAPPQQARRPRAHRRSDAATSRQPRTSPAPSRPASSAR